VAASHRVRLDRAEPRATAQARATPAGDRALGADPRPKADGVLGADTEPHVTPGPKSRGDVLSRSSPASEDLQSRAQDADRPSDGVRR
jgi:hypothetical protein